MVRNLFLSLLATFFAAPAQAEGLEPGAWQLSSIDSEPFTLTATLLIGADGRITGMAPCNRWFARGVGEDGALFGAIGSTKMACEGLDEEQRYLGFLAEMTTAAASADRLVLTGAGHEMAFVPLPD